MDGKRSDEYTALKLKDLDNNAQIVKHELTNSANSSSSDYRFRDGLYQSFVSLGVLSVLVHPGICVTLTTILYPQLSITKYQNSWIAGLLSVGMPVGSLFVGPMMDKIGRKRTCIFTAMLYSITWAMTIALPENFDLNLLYTIRFISGIACGLATSVIVYISEVTNKHWRPVFLSTVSVFLASGVLVAATVGIMMSWRSFAVFNFVVSLFNIIVLIFVPESPYWLLRSCPDKAKRALMKLNKNKNDFNEEWENLETRRLARESSTFKKARLLSREVRRPMIRLALVFTFQQLGGGYLVIVYALQMFQAVVHSTSVVPVVVATPATNLTLAAAAILPLPTEVKHQFRLDDLDTRCFIGVGVIRVGMSALAVLLSKHVNNRVILISSAAGAAVSAFAFSAVFSGMFGPVKDVVPLSFILLFLLLQSYGMLVIPWAQIGELIPLSYRAKGGGFMTAYTYVLMFIAVKGYPYAIDWVGLSGVYVFFGVVATLLCFYVYFYIPETRGKTFKEIEEFFK